MSLYGEDKNAKRLTADSTSLADLKAELHRKRGEAANNKVKGNFRPEKVNNEGEKKNNIWSKKNTGLIIRMQRDLEKRKEEERSYERAKYMLEKKQKLYESMKKGKGNSLIADNFLVDFSGGVGDEDDEEDLGNINYPARRADEEWVEYTDALGRTRKCMKKDLKDLQKKDKDIVRNEDEELETGEGLRKEEPDQLSAEMRMDMLRQKWEQQELENLTKSNLHYADVRFDEARAHGAGFYNFSHDEDQRLQEQKTLKKLHEETDAMRILKERKAEKRKKDMAARIKMIKAKKREKAGLPPESDSDSDNEDDSGNTSKHDDDNENEAEDITKSVMEGLKMFRRNNEEQERQRNQAMREASSGARAWDRDKEFKEEDLGRSKEWKVMSQDQWNTAKREERNPDFAPPSAYSEARFLLKNKEQAMNKTNAKKQKQSPVKTKFPTAIPQRSMGPPPSPGMMMPPPPFPPPGLIGPPPPPGMMGPPPQVSVGPPPPPGMMGPSPQGLIGPPSDPMAYLDANPDPELYQPPPPEPKPPAASYSKAVRLELHKRMQNQDTLPSSGLNSRVLEAFNDSDDDDEKDEDTSHRGNGVEIAPPCDMNYFNAGSNQKKQQGSRSHYDMADAFAAGLAAMKK